MKPQNISGPLTAVKPASKLKPILFFTCLSLALASGAVLTGCSTKKSAFSGKGSPIYTGSGAIPKGGGRYKVGSPYKIIGKRYTPRENTSYDRTGTASWYGPKFHKRMTANGEWYDMNQMTAAHPTLPLPVFARVTNLKNGRTVIVRVNDRGPYAHNREIDMSRAAARKLGFIKQGTAPVRVQYLGKAPLSAYARNYYGPGQNATRYAKSNKTRPVRVATVPVRKNRTYGPQMANTAPASSRRVRLANIPANSIYIQAASYSNIDNAIRARSNLAAIGRVEMTRIEIGHRSYYRLRVGPMHNSQSARQALGEVVDAGHVDARIVTTQ